MVPSRWTSSPTAACRSGTTPAAPACFSFAGLPQPLTAFAPLDLTQLSGGNFSLQLTGPNTLTLTLDNLNFSSEYGSLTAQVASAVPEPASLVLLGAGLAVVALRRARRAA